MKQNLKEERRGRDRNSFRYMSDSLQVGCRVAKRTNFMTIVQSWCRKSSYWREDLEIPGVFRSSQTCWICRNP